MKFTLVCLMMIFSLISCQLDSFKDKFILEVEKMKPQIKDKNLEKIISKIASTYNVEMNNTLKTVDLNKILNNCSYDFEIKLVKSKNLPASDHQIANIIVGDLKDLGQPKPEIKNDLWKCTVGVAKAKGNNTVSLLTYFLSVRFDKISFEGKTGVDLPDIDERVLANAIFYQKLLKIIKNEPARPIIYDITRNATLLGMLLIKILNKYIHKN